MLSTGNVMTEIQLDRSPSTLIVGQNGAGKSTILDALCFVLFNKPFRNIRKPQLINTINEKDMMVEIEFVIGRNKYLIRRGMKPNIFEIVKNGKMIDQPGNSRDYQKILEDTILRLNYKSFTQIVVLGNASFTPFMQLFAAERRAVIEDLLDIQVFTSMNLLLKDRISENKQKKGDINYQIDLNKDKIAVQEEYLKKIAKDRKKQIEDLKSESSDFVEKIGANEEQTKTLLENIDAIFESMPDKDSLKSKSERVSDLLFKLEDKLTKAGKKSKFFSENDNCPTCEQQIDIEVKADKVNLSKFLRKVVKITLFLESLLKYFIFKSLYIHLKSIMNYKFLYLFIFLSFNCFASYEQIKIGKIDDYYKDKISQQQLKNILDEIEETLETQLNMNIFDYSSNGKPIDILYVPDSKLETSYRNVSTDLSCNCLPFKS